MSKSRWPLPSPCLAILSLLVVCGACSRHVAALFACAGCPFAAEDRRNDEVEAGWEKLRQRRAVLHHISWSLASNASTCRKRRDGCAS